MHSVVQTDNTTKRKPNTVTLYNTTKCGVDVMDQMVREYTVRRGTRRWPVAVFYNMIDMAALNAHVLYQACTGTQERRVDFLVELARELANSHMAGKTARKEQLLQTQPSTPSPAKRATCQTRPLYCRINLSVPVLDRYFNNEDTRPDFRLSRETPEDLHAMSNGFAQLAGHRAFVKAGAIDCCHVRIKLPSGPDDGGYPCLQHPLPLVTPYKRPVHGVGAQRFNAHHAMARSVIERAFGMMKTRFRAIFLQALEVHHTFVPHVITACAVLHNICIGAGDIVARDEEPEDDAQDEGETGVEAVSGAHWLDQLSAEVSALEEVPPDHDYCQQASIP
ncbi:hypothetical protein ACER0C_003561 [Sarotherodon galilaeus]